MPINVIFLTMKKVHWGKVYNPNGLIEPFFLIIKEVEGFYLTSPHIIRGGIKV